MVDQSIKEFEVGKSLESNLDGEPKCQAIWFSLLDGKPKCQGIWRHEFGRVSRDIESSLNGEPKCQES